MRYAEFAAGAKMRHDVADQIQVRYVLAGENYDAWVSGEEVLSRMRSAGRERLLRGLSRLTPDDLRQGWRRLRDDGPARARDEAERALRDRLADATEGAIGGNVIGDSLANALRGGAQEGDPGETEKARWTTALAAPDFREGVLRLAWVALRGSFPEGDEGETEDPGDWL